MQVGQINNTTINQQLIPNNRDQSLSTQTYNNNNNNINNTNNINNNTNNINNTNNNNNTINNSMSMSSQQVSFHINKSYSLCEFIQIMQSLNEQDVLYQCQEQQLQLIYQKTVQHQHRFTGQCIREFAQVLKQKNKQKFIQEINFYKQYIRLNVQMNQTEVQSKQLLNSVYVNEQVGYLTSAVYQITKSSPSQYISIDKLQQLINRVQQQFKQYERVSIPRRVLVKKTIYLEQQGENQQQLQQQVVFELLQQSVNNSNNIQHIDLQSLRTLKQQTLQYIEDTQVGSKLQREFNKLQQSINTINTHTIPLFKQQLTTIKQYNSKLQQQLTTLYQQLQNKHTQLIDNKNILLELTDQNRLINKQLINTKIQLNQKHQTIYQLQTQLIKANNQSIQYKNKTEEFFNQYTNLKSQYQNFIQQIKLQHQTKTKLQQTNLLPTISLKQQLQDAQFKIRKLKSDKQQLLKEMQLNQNIFAAKLITLQRQLQQARVNANRTEQLKFTGVSRLSKNYQAFKNSKSMMRRSINPSLISVFIQSNKQNNNKKMSCYVQQVNDYMASQSYIKRDKLIKEQSQLTNSNNSKFVNSNNYNRESIVSKVNINSKSSNNTNSNNDSNKTVNNKQQMNKQKGYQQLFLFQDQQCLQQQFNRQSKQQQPKFNFTQINYQQLQIKWKGQHPDVLHDDQIQSFSQSQQHILNAQQIVNANMDNNLTNDNKNNNINSNNTQNVQNNSHNKVQDSVVSLQELKQTYMRDKPQTVFITPADIISKSGIKYKKHLFFNRKGIFMFDTKLRLQKIIKYTKINTITFTYYNLDTFVISFKRKQISPMMKKKSTTNQGDLIFKCLRTKQLLSFLSQPIFNKFILKQSLVKVMIQKQSNIWIHDSNDKDMLLLNCASFYNPFRLNLSLKNQHNKMFYAQLSRQNYFSRSHIIICIVEQFGVYCFQWNEDQLQKEKKFIYLLPLVKRMIFIRQQQSDTVKVVYEDWSDGKTFLLKFKNYKESLRFQTICRHQLKANLNVLEDRKKAIQNVFQSKENQNN